MTAQETLELLKEKFLSQESNGSFVIHHYAQALPVLQKIWGHWRLDILQIDELAACINKEHPETRRQLTQRLGSFLAEFLACGFFLEVLPEDFNEENALNTFLGYWTVISYTNSGGNLLPDDVDLKDKFALLLKKSKPPKINLRYQNLEKANLSYLILEYADFSYADLDNALLVYAKITKSSFYNTDIRQAKLMNIDLSDSFLSFANLKGANLLSAKIQDSVMHGANCEQADLSEANLKGTNLDYVRFVQADLTMAVLSEVSGIQSDFNGANLSKTQVNASHWREANFKNTVLDFSNFQEAELEDCNWEIKSAFKANFQTARLNQQSKNILRKHGALID